jgi:hypothetical protein
MRRLVVIVAVAFLALAVWLGPRALENRRLPSANRVEMMLAEAGATTDTAAEDRFYGNGAPFDCHRWNGSTDEVKDVDFICTPRLKNGKRCKDGQCAGFLVDVEDDRIKAYRQFGGG